MPRSALLTIRLLFALAWITALRVGSAHANVREAEVQFAEGTALLAAGNVPAACKAFEASNRLDPRAGTLIRIGDCREQTNELASALAAYKGAFARAKDPAKRKYASDKVVALGARVSTLTIMVPADAELIVTRNGNPVAKVDLNRPLPVDGGKYKIVATGATHESFETVVTVATASARIVVEIPALRRAGSPPVAIDPPPVATAPSKPVLVPTPQLPAQRIIEVNVLPSPPTPRRDEPRLWERPTFWLGVSLAVAAGSVAIYAATRPDGITQCMPPMCFEVQ